MTPPTNKVKVKPKAKPRPELGMPVIRNIMGQGGPIDPEPDGKIPHFKKFGTFKSAIASAFAPRAVSEGANIYNTLVDYMNQRKPGEEMSDKEKSLRERIAKASGFGYPKSAGQLREHLEAIRKGTGPPASAQLDEKLESTTKLRREMMRKYMGLPTDALVESKHKPTKSKNPNAVYYDFADRADLIANISKAGFDKIYEDADAYSRALDSHRRLGNNSMLDYIYYNANPLTRGYEDEATGKVYKTPTSQLGAYTTGVGRDKYGRYVSYYDKWDLDAPIVKGMGVDINKVANPYEIYGRVYEHEILKYEGKPVPYYATDKAMKEDEEFEKWKKELLAPTLHQHSVEATDALRENKLMHPLLGKPSHPNRPPYKITNKKELGGQIGQMAGQSLNMVAPGVGEIAAPLLGIAGELIEKKITGANRLNKQWSRMTANTNPFGYQYGGALTGRHDLAMYKGRSHRNGGIMVSAKGTPSANPEAEVEGGEARIITGDKTFIFSKKLKVK